MSCDELLALFSERATAPPPEASLLLARHLQCKNILNSAGSSDWSETKESLARLLVSTRQESAMSIRQEATELKAKVQEELGEKFNIIAGDTERVRAAGTIDGALKIGQSVSDFTLPDAFGNQVSLKTLLAKGPAVVSFYRGEWCPFCNLELRALQEVLPEMEKLGATLIAISPERPDRGVIATDKNKLTFPVLSDFGNKVARQFGIVFQMGQEVVGTLRIIRIPYLSTHLRPRTWQTKRR
jgi:peroxiredoxin